MKAYLKWFALFCRDWNDIAIIQPTVAAKEIFVDASLTGIGAHDGKKAYGTQIGGDHQLVRNIAELEAMNVVIAFTHSSMNPMSENILRYIVTMLPVCTRYSQGKNKVLLLVAQAVWMIEAHIDISIYHINNVTVCRHGTPQYVPRHPYNT